MKLFSYIMALYMMVLFMMPCADMFEKEFVSDHHHASEITQEHAHDHANAFDFCTPFCVCGCCGLVSGVVIQHLQIFELNELNSFHFSPTNNHYKSVFIPWYVSDIWQPPKIKVLV